MAVRVEAQVNLEVRVVRRFKNSLFRFLKDRWCSIGECRCCLWVFLRPSVCCLREVMQLGADPGMSGGLPLEGVCSRVSRRDRWSPGVSVQETVRGVDLLGTLVA